MPVRSSRPILQVKKGWMKKICTMTRASRRKAGADEYICKSIEVRKYLTSDGVAAEHGKKIALYCEKEIWAMATLGLCFRYINEDHFVSHMQFHCVDSGSEEFQETVSRLRRGENVYGWSIQCLQLPKVDTFGVGDRVKVMAIEGKKQKFESAIVDELTPLKIGGKLYELDYGAVLANGLYYVSPDRKNGAVFRHDSELRHIRREKHQNERQQDTKADGMVYRLHREHFSVNTAVCGAEFWLRLPRACNLAFWDAHDDELTCRQWRMRHRQEMPSGRGRGRGRGRVRAENRYNYLKSLSVEKAPAP